MRRAIVATIVCLLALPFAAGAASARLQEPPDTWLVTSAGEQKGAIYAYEWPGKPQEGICSMIFADGTKSWPEPVAFEPGKSMALRFDGVFRPARVRVAVGAAVDPFTGDVVGPSESPEVTIHRQRFDGSWLATFDPPPWPELYIDATVTWRAPGYCGPHRAYMAFHARVV